MGLAIRCCDRHHFRPVSHVPSALYHPAHAVWRALLGNRGPRVLIGACNPMLCPNWGPLQVQPSGWSAHLIRPALPPDRLRPQGGFVLGWLPPAALRLCVLQCCVAHYQPRCLPSLRRPPSMHTHTHTPLCPRRHQHTCGTRAHSKSRHQICSGVRGGEGGKGGREVRIPFPPALACWAVTVSGAP